MQALVVALLVFFKRLQRDAEILYLRHKLICEGFCRDSAGLLQSAYPVLECLFHCIHEGLNICYHLRHTLQLRLSGAQGALGESGRLAVRVDGASHFFNSGNQPDQALTHILLVPRHLVDVRA